MRDSKLDSLIDKGLIVKYTYQDINDTNRNGDDIFYEKLVIVFVDGTTLTITPSTKQLNIE